MTKKCVHFYLSVSSVQPYKWQGPVNTGDLAALMDQLEWLHPIQMGAQGWGLDSCQITLLPAL